MKIGRKRKTMFNLAVSALCGWAAWTCFRDDNKFWGWLNLIGSAANFALFLRGIL